MKQEGRRLLPWWNSVIIVTMFDWDSANVCMQPTEGWLIFTGALKLIIIRSVNSVLIFLRLWSVGTPSESTRLCHHPRPSPSHKWPCCQTFARWHLPLPDTVFASAKLKLFFLHQLCCATHMSGLDNSGIIQQITILLSNNPQVLMGEVSKQASH